MPKSVLIMGKDLMVMVLGEPVSSHTKPDIFADLAMNAPGKMMNLIMKNMLAMAVVCQSFG